MWILPPSDIKHFTMDYQKSNSTTFQASKYKRQTNCGFKRVCIIVFIALKTPTVSDTIFRYHQFQCHQFHLMIRFSWGQRSLKRGYYAQMFKWERTCLKFTPTITDERKGALGVLRSRICGKHNITVTFLCIWRNYSVMCTSLKHVKKFSNKHTELAFVYWVRQ